MDNNLEQFNSTLSLVYNSPIGLLKGDKWNAEDLGFSVEDIGSCDSSLSFKSYHCSWLKNLAKETVWKKRMSVKFNTLRAYTRGLKSFDRFIVKNHTSLRSANDLTRAVMEEYFALIGVLKPATRQAYISQLSEIFTCWNEWGILYLPSYRLIHRDDKPSNEIVKNPRFLSVQIQADVSKAINEIGDIFNGSAEKFPFILARVSTILQETGMRGNEALHLKKDCLTQDLSGDWHLTRTDTKVGSKEHTVPITHKLHAVIIDQLHETNLLEDENSNKLGRANKENFLFVHKWRGSLKTYSLRRYNDFLKEVGEKISLKDHLGIQQKLSSHVFRHTVGTNLINSGVAQHLVQKFLGHSSPGMTALYAEIHDETLKKSIMMSSGRMVDIKGRFYDATDVLCEMDVVVDECASLDSQWLKRNIATQTLPNGVCSLPSRQGCPHANKCLSCSSFRTDASYLPMHKEQLDRTVLIIKEAEDKGYKRQVEINQPLIESLTTVIEALEVNG